MDDKELLKKVEDKVKGVAKAVEDFVDEVAAPEDPPVFVQDQDTPKPKPTTSGSKDSKGASGKMKP